MKQCVRCEQLLPLDSFYRQSRMADGHLTVCKECVKVRVRTHRAANVNAAREYDRRRFHENPERRAAQYENSRRMNAKYPENRKARAAVTNAVRDGRLAKLPCEVCGSAKSEAHHDDYAKPLDVRWLCREHHMAVHYGQAG